MKKQTTIGIDIGGTNIKGLIQKNGKILLQKKIKTNKEQSKEKTLDKIYKLIEKLLTETKIKIKNVDGIGIGIPGPSENGTIIKLHNLPNLNNLNIVKILKEKYKTKIKITNDAHLVHYAIKPEIKEKNCAFITLGTSIGTSLCLNNKLYVGRGNSSEFAHTHASSKTKDIGEVISKKYLIQKAQKKKLKVENVKELGKLAKTDNKARKIFEEYGKNLGLALANLHSILDLEKIYISGGISNNHKYFLEQTINTFKKNCFLEACEIEIIKKPYEIGAYGASQMFK